MPIAPNKSQERYENHPQHIEEKKKFEKIDGVKFFDNRDHCIAYAESKSLIKKSISCLRSIGNHIFSFVELVQRLWQEHRGDLAQYADPATIDTSKNVLILGLHGLNSSPCQMKKIFDELKTTPDTAICIPKIRKKGNTKLDKVVDEYMALIKNWNSNGENKTLILVGVSNGGRIARAIEAKLKEIDPENMHITKIKFLSVVGAHRGSSFVNFVKHIPLSWLFIPKSIANEMPMGSERNKQLDKDCQESLEKHSSIKREYICIASQHDDLIPDYESSLRNDIGTHKATYAIVPNHRHNSIVNRTAKAVAQLIMRPFEEE